MNEKNKIKVGDVFQTSWGYDQTNYDFVVVEKFSPSGKTAICRKAAYDYVEDDSCMTQDALKPKSVGFGLPFRLRVNENSLKGSYPFLSRWDDNWDDDEKKDWLNSKRMGWFSKVDKDRNYYQTNPMFGH